MALPMNGTVFAVVALISQKKIINCVMPNKMAQNERMNLVKHIHIVQGKF